MEYVSAPEFLRQCHLLEADDAGRINANSVGWIFKIDVGKSLQLINKGPWFYEKLDRLVEFDKRVNAFSQKVERELSSHKYPPKKFGVEHKDDAIENESRDVKDEAFLNPLLSVIKLNGRKLVFEIVLNPFEE